jgi:uncharacterized membrane protein YfcA
MGATEFTMLLFAGAFTAGIFGALTGMGGGVILVPMLVLLYHVNVRYAVGASLISVIATSSGAAAAYVREGYTNIRIGMFLLMAACSGALMGAVIAQYFSTGLIAIIFGLVLLFSSYLSFRRKEGEEPDTPADPLAVKLRMCSSYPSLDGWKPYRVYHVIAGFAVMLVAGVLSGLLGIGSGSLNVLSMDQAMRLPYKVSTTTSNFMIGITAATSAGIYLGHGLIVPGITMPVMLGVFFGAVLGAKLLMFFKTKYLRMFFSVVILLVALEMIYNGLRGRI